MFLDKYGIKLFILDDFPINLCGVEDSVKNYQTYLVSCCAVMAFEFNCRILFFSCFFSFCHSYLDLSHDFHAQLCFHSYFIFTAHTSLGCRLKCLIGRLFYHKPDRLLSGTLYRFLVAAHVILKVSEEDAVNDVLFATLLN